MLNAMKQFLVVLGCLFVAVVLVSIGGAMSSINPSGPGRASSTLKEPSLLVLNLEGVIMPGDDFHFLDFLRKFKGEENVKGILVKINSPGGTVGTSQEIYTELKRVREELQKPVVVTVQDMAASGGYYSAIAADRIVTNAGALMGSIGVIMNFSNLERLYDWAKIQPYTIKTGKFKDSGTPSRAMTQEEKQLFQEMINEVWEQFKGAVAKNRKLAPDIVEKYSDGRIFTGEAAVKLGFADQVGSFEDAVRIAGDLAGLGEDPKLFEPKSRKNELYELLMDSLSPTAFFGKKLDRTIKVQGTPLFLMPGAAGL